MKKFLAIVLTFAMLFSMSVSVFADDVSTDGGSTVIDVATDGTIPEATGDTTLEVTGETTPVVTGNTAPADEDISTEEVNGMDLGRVQSIEPMLIQPMVATTYKISPSDGPAGTIVTITAEGTGNPFNSGQGPYTVTFDHTTVNATVIDSNHLTCTAPVHTAGEVNVDVNSKGGKIASFKFTYTNTKVNQIIQVTKNAPANAIYNTSFAVTAAASSSLPVIITVSGPCKITSGGTDSAIITMTGGSGTASVHYNQEGNTNYNAAPEVSENIIAQKAALTITAKDAGKSYGETKTFDGTEFTTAGLVNGDTVDKVSLTSVGTVVTAAVKTYDIIASAAQGAGLDNYNITYVKGTLTVAPKALTITAKDIVKTYGEAKTFDGTEFTTTGLVNGDTVDKVSLTSAGTVVTAGVKTYDVTASAAQGTGLDNYNITYAKGTLTVVPKALTITANHVSKTYGDADPDLTYQITDGSLVAGDSFTGSLTREDGEDVGTYAINLGTLALNSNYILTSVPGKLTITARLITVTAEAKSKTYGDTDPALAYQITSGSLVTGDSFTGNLTREDGEGVGIYAIQRGTLSAGGNYSMTFVEADLTITPALLTVTADNKSRAYGTANPTLTYTITGFVKGETASVITGAPELSCTATATTPVSSSPVEITITQGTLSADNYSFTMANGALTIMPYKFTGFFKPVDMGSVVNTVKAGSAIPIKFSLNGNMGLKIFADGYPKAIDKAFDPNSPYDTIPTIDTPGNSSLSYDPVTDQYTYVWKTEKGWAGLSKQLVVILADGTVCTANFKFNK